MVLILLPPSEGKARPRRGNVLDLSALSFPSLTAARERVIDALVQTCHLPDAAEILGLGARLVAEVDHNTELRSAPTARADAIYTGVLFDALGFESLSPEARRRATRRVVITSSVFGIVRPTDRIPAYRLSGDVTLPGLGPVAALWRESMGAAVLGSLGDGLLVDLRSSTYANFWRPPRTLGPWLASVRVLHESGGKRSVVSHFNKATKGKLVRALMEDGGQPTTPEELCTQLRDLGWYVESASGSSGTRLDVVVTELHA